MGPRFVAKFLIESPFDIESVAAEMLGEQSTSTHTRLTAETTELIANHGARIEGIEHLAHTSAPSIPTTLGTFEKYNRARVAASWPIANVGSSLSILWTTLIGNQMGMRRLTGIRLEHLALPQQFVDITPRPQFGISGTRRLTSVYDRPLVGCIIKPNIGLTPKETAATARAMIDGGVDFIKDDELIADPPYSPLHLRVKEVMREINEAAQRTGRKIMYAVNISDEIDNMKRHHDAVLAEGGTCVMVNINSVGLAGVIALRRHSALVIHAHRAGWAALTRAPFLGMGYQPYQVFARLSGVDHMHVSGLGRKFWEDEDTVFTNTKSLLTPLSAEGDDRAMPVLSGGSTVLEVAPTFAGVQTTDLIMTSGGGIASHPAGISAGCRSLRQAWQAVVEGIDIDEYASAHPELAAAIDHVRANRARQNVAPLHQ